MDERHGVIVVGGGAAGLVAAIAAARAGAPVTLLERQPRVGKKLLATGNGRCNLANARLDLGRYHGADPAFAAPALAAFGVEATLGFFSGLGVAAREEEEGKIFPRSGQASSVLDLLRHELARRPVEIRCEAAVTRLTPRGDGWEAATPDGAVRGVDPGTLASRLAPGLFFAGEILDIDGDCGGFNLQWAWSSGLVAGAAAAARALARPPRSAARGGRPAG